MADIRRSTMESRTRLLDMCPKVMFSSGAGYKAETESLLFRVVRAGAAQNRPGDSALVLLAGMHSVGH
jgi:hypothetical protein